MVFTRFSGCTDSQTHSQTDTPETIKLPAPKVFGSIKIKYNNQTTTKNSFCPYSGITLVNC